MNELKKQLEPFGRVRANVALSRFSAFKIGGPAQFLIAVDDNAKLADLLSFISGEGVDWCILGGGTNILFPDDGLEGVVVKIAIHKPASPDERASRGGSQIINQKLIVDAGVALSSAVNESIAAGLAGLEWAAGIPGSVGGAVRGNAGARYAFSGGEMKDSIASVKVWRSGEVIDLSNADCGFGYRDSAFKQNNDVIISATFNLKPGDKKALLAITQKIIAERHGKQPSEPSAGSFFKNVFLDQWNRDQAELTPRFLEYKKIAAGWLIEQAGLKGYRVGQAMVSPSHGNFIVNLGGASQADVLAVVDKVQSEVYNRFGIALEPEVQIIT